jgi:precorrin-6A synthase
VRRVLLIGIGTGDPAFLTMQAVDALNAAQVFFVFDKGEEKHELIAVRKAICDRYVRAPATRFVAIDNPPRDSSGDYREGVDAWHQARAERLREALRTHIPEGGCGAFLVWGDPALYDSTLRVVDRALAGTDLAVEVEIIPGIGSVQVLTARHKIGLNEIGAPVHITTGRRLLVDGLPPRGVSTVVMLDGDLAARAFLGRGMMIYWGAALGGADETLIAGPLDAVIDDIVTARAALRAKHGWVMDTYLLRQH